MTKDSKIKLDQIRTVSEELILKKKDSADAGIREAIGSYLVEEAKRLIKGDKTI